MMGLMLMLITLHDHAHSNHFIILIIVVCILYTYTHTHIYIYTYIHTHIYIYIYIQKTIYIYTYTCSTCSYIIDIMEPDRAKALDITGGRWHREGHQPVEGNPCHREADDSDAWCFFRRHVGISGRDQGSDLNLGYTKLSGWWFGTFFIFPYIGNNHPNWLSYFSEGFKPPTSCDLNGHFMLIQIEIQWDLPFGDFTQLWYWWFATKNMWFSHGHVKEPRGYDYDLLLSFGIFGCEWMGYKWTKWNS